MLVPIQRVSHGYDWCLVMSRPGPAQKLQLGPSLRGLRLVESSSRAVSPQGPEPRPIVCSIVNGVIVFTHVAMEPPGLHAVVGTALSLVWQIVKDYHEHLRPRRNMYLRYLVLLQWPPLSSQIHTYHHLKNFVHQKISG